MKKQIIGLAILTIHFLSATENFIVTDTEYQQYISQFPDHIRKVVGQVTWYYRTPKFLRKRAVSAMGYNAKTATYLKGVQHCFNSKKITNEYVRYLCNAHKAEFLDFTNSILAEITQNGAISHCDINAVALIIHTRCIENFTHLLSSTQIENAINDAQLLITYQKQGLINIDDYCKAIIRDLFVEFITTKRTIVKKSIPGWLSWLF